MSAASGAGNDTDITVRDTRDDQNGNQTGSIPFNATTWNTYRTVTLAARDDADKESGSRTINHTVNGGGYSNITGSVTANEAEDDHAIILTPLTGVTITEGSTATYTVKLASAPTATVTIAVAGATTGDHTDPSITVAPATLTFTPTGSTIWSTAQTVTLTAAQDSDRFDGSRTINHTATSTDSNYSNLTVSLLAQEDDDDSPHDRDTLREFSLHTNNGSPYGIWTDGTTMWVTDDQDYKLYAYTLATGARDTSKEFNLNSNNRRPYGIWSDGTTIWVTNYNSTKMYAYTLATGAQDTSKEFTLFSSHRFAGGIWSDGTTMYVTHVRQLGSQPGVRLRPGDRGPRHDQGLRPAHRQRRSRRYLVRRHDYVGGRRRRQGVRVHPGGRRPRQRQGFQPGRQHHSRPGQRQSRRRLVRRHDYVGGGQHRRQGVRLPRAHPHHAPGGRRRDGDLDAVDHHLAHRGLVV